jgi:hypothetical protein
MPSHSNARSVAALFAVLATCFLVNAQASDSVPKAAVSAIQASTETSPRTRDQENVITAERTKAAPVPEPTGLLTSCLLGGVLLAIGQRLRSLRGGAA